MINKESLIKEWDEILKNPKNVAMQGGKESDALIQRIHESNMTSDELKDLLVDIMKKCLRKRMELEVELSSLMAKSPP